MPPQHALPPYAPPLPPGYPPHMRMPQPLQGASRGLLSVLLRSAHMSLCVQAHPSSPFRR